MRQLGSKGLHALRLSVAVAIAAIGTSGCAYVSPKPAPGQPGADKVAVYETMPTDQREYKLLKRLWVEPWTSAIDVPRYPSVAAGEDDLRNHAVLLGGDAVVNFGCYHSRVDPNSSYYCNGSVIRYVQ